MMARKAVYTRMIANLSCVGAIVSFAGCGGGGGGSLGNNGPVVGQGTTLLAITAGNSFIRFDASAPGTIAGPQTIVGLQPGETIRGIDLRPSNNQVYALGSTNRLYILNPLNNPITATEVGGPFAVPLPAASFGFDVNPVADSIRVVTDTGLNLRLNPANGTIVDADPATPGLQLDGALAYAAGDINAGTNPAIVAAAFNNNDTNGATGTTEYAIDSNLNTLVTQGSREGVAPAISPNTGQLFTVGPLGVDVTSVVGFDISSANTAFAVFTVVGQANSQLYSINLTTGRATLVGPVGGGQQVTALTFGP